MSYFSMIANNMSHLSIPVVIPYYRAPVELRRCIAAVEAQMNIRTEVFIRDNSDDNILFTCAINEGLRRFSFSDEFEYVLILNQDAYLHPTCLARLVWTMRENPGAGIVCPIQVDHENRVTWFGSMEAYPWGAHNKQAMASPTDLFSTYWANGAAMLLRISMVREIGLLDENMQFIFSDADYSFTARARGWEVLVAPDAKVEHSLGASSSATNPWLEKIKLQDQLYFSHKWLTGGLYKNLALEGPALTLERIRQEVERSEISLQLLKNSAPPWFRGKPQKSKPGQQSDSFPEISPAIPAQSRFRL